MVEMMNHQEMNISSSSSSSSTLVDVSSFWLFESTGDSEFDTNFYSEPMDSSFTINPSHQRFLVDDDAQSSNEDMDLDFRIENEDNHDDDNDDDDDEVDSSSCSRVFNRRSVGWNNDIKDDDEDDEDEGDVVEQRWINGVNSRLKKSKSSVSRVVDSEFKSQKDKDKLFWETCLAS
ncbi:uncharacterized protein LOC132062173 [Lycium ferocissimum]|uniref:uncharacterized protein LOC132062173 n=1 Tax=Lycium ferocissimum TaxID=112874 RepID=UPI002815E475|nr:uncharacterized protein LOC132062173 [Lycium ferocissimum]